MSNWMNSGSKWMEGVKNLVVGTKVSGEGEIESPPVMIISLRTSL